jgi:hypothetical protein
MDPNEVEEITDEMHDEMQRYLDERTPEQISHDEFVLGLRQLAQFYSDNPDFPVPAQWYRNFSIEVSKKDSLASLVKQMAPAKKKSTEYDFEWQRDFGNVQLRLSIYKSKVCRQIKTGNKTWVPEEPPKEARPGYWKEEVKWECDGVPNGDNDETPPE